MCVIIDNVKFSVKNVYLVFVEGDSKKKSEVKLSF